MHLQSSNSCQSASWSALIPRLVESTSECYPLGVLCICVCARVCAHEKTGLEIESEHAHRPQEEARGLHLLYISHGGWSRSIM